MASTRKILFAPVPLRAIGLKLTGLEFGVLACVAAHDRMSDVTKRGQGCTATKRRIALMVSCDPTRVCTALSALCDRGLLKREQRGRSTVYRVSYIDEDEAYFSRQNPPQPVRASSAVYDTIACNSDRKNGRKLRKTEGQYIPRSGRDFVETNKQGIQPETEDDASEEPPLPSPRYEAEFEAIQSGWQINWAQYEDQLPELIERLKALGAEATKDQRWMLVSRIGDLQADITFIARQTRRAGTSD